jgi:2-oxo-4-hydroxy-4-carboxy-5-ureidoimidazoline decarboxylase
MGEADAQVFDRLNAAYRARFGFPFIIAVRGRGRAEIRSIFEARLGRDPAVEEATALEEVAQITRMRLDRLITP